jgi:hypothetical protein
MAGELLSKMEQAAQLLAESLTFTAAPTVNLGQDDQRLAARSIVCSATKTGQEIPLYSGNFVVKLRVELKVNPADFPKATQQADAKVLTDAFSMDDIGAELGALVTGFYAYDPRLSIDHGNESAEHTLTNWVEVDLLCCETDIT